MPLQKMMTKMEQSSCTEDRIQHVLERCLCGLGLNTPDKQLWNAGLCISRWCLEELVKRDPHNFLILLQKILRKTKEVLEQCRYELVVPLTLLFSSTLLKVSISFQRLVRTEQGISPEIHSKTMTVLLVSPDEDVPLEVQSVSEQLGCTAPSSRDVAILLIVHGFQATLGTDHDPQALHAALQTKRPEELEQLMEAVTDRMETAASTAGLSAARQGAVETFMLPIPKCQTCSWENDNFDVLNGILESNLDFPPDCFLKTEVDEDDNYDTSVDEEDELEGNKVDNGLQSHRVSSASSSSRDSGYSLFSSWSAVSTLSGSSGVESDFSEEATHKDTEEGQSNQPKLRKKPKKKSRSILGVERLSSLFKSPRSPSVCRRAQSMGYREDFTKDVHRNGSQLKYSTTMSRHVQSLHASTATLDPLAPRKHVCVRRRPILSCDEGDVAEAPTLLKVVVFGGDREAGRLARAYNDLQQRESKCPRLTKTCKLQFYLVPTKRRMMGSQGGHTPTEGPMGSSTKAAAAVESNGGVLDDSSTDIAQMLGMIDPWYEQNVLSLLSLSSDVLCQTACKEGDESVSSGSVEQLPLLADMVLYYCRHADQPVLVQLYQAEVRSERAAKEEISEIEEELERMSRETEAEWDRKEAQMKEDMKILQQQNKFLKARHLIVKTQQEVVELKIALEAYDKQLSRVVVEKDDLKTEMSEYVAKLEKKAQMEEDMKILQQQNIKLSLSLTELQKKNRETEKEWHLKVTQREEDVENLTRKNTELRVLQLSLQELAQKTDKEKAKMRRKEKKAEKEDLKCLFVGAASKRFGIDEEREAVPLTLSVAYNKVAVSGRSRWTQTEMVCTSINLYKACRKPEQLDSRIESLQLTMTEVLKRQCPKSKKGFNQHISVSEVKVDKVQMNGEDAGTTFAVCLDQDEKKFIQSVTRCDVSLCCKPGSGSDWRSYKPSPGQVQPLHPSYCSLLCLPITSFTASFP
ncbi:hypothetical protein FQN60_004336 [Etheostoma spectabile]|uniref:Phosphoinositide 3-kinase regulatory subunit 5 n=1 Tax=Etheostoma spectabile TaxID=54343 RepID=A0A5J5CTB8_9PERO|nr:hypothetical protein FQN60_004336 [Etheostoma spectabile]